MAPEHDTRPVPRRVGEARARDVVAVGATVQGDVVTEICCAAEDATVLVVGAHGCGTVRRLVFGSVSSALLHEAPCPLLVVREDVPVAQRPPVVDDRVSRHLRGTHAASV